MMKKLYVLERRVSTDRRKSPRQYFDDGMLDRRQRQGVPPIITLSDLSDPSLTAHPRLSTH